MHQIYIFNLDQERLDTSNNRTNERKKKENPIPIQEIQKCKSLINQADSLHRILHVNNPHCQRNKMGDKVKKGLNAQRTKKRNKNQITLDATIIHNSSMYLEKKNTERS